MDGDLEVDVKDIPKLIEEFEAIESHKKSHYRD